MQAIFRDGRGFGIGGVGDTDGYRLIAARASGEEGVGKRERQAEVVFLDDIDTFGRAVERVVGIVADADFDIADCRHRRYHITFRGGLPGDEILGLAHVESVAFDGRFGAERERVVVIVGRGVDLDDETFDEARQVLREFERDAVFAAGLHTLEFARFGDYAAFGVGSFEIRRERGRALRSEEHTSELQSH